MFRSLCDLLRRLTLAAGLLFLLALLIATPIVAALEWGLAGLLTVVSTLIAWHGGMLWESIRRKPADDAFAKHIAPMLKGDDWWRRQ